MKPGETIRIACGECKIVFDLCVAPASEWAEDFNTSTEPVNDIEPTCCPLSGPAPPCLILSQGVEHSATSEEMLLPRLSRARLATQYTISFFLDSSNCVR